MKKKKSNHNPIFALSLFFIVILLWLGSWYLITNQIIDNNERGTFGDMFGVVNSLFSGLAFAGLIYTIYLQSKELSLQREELEQTREELKGQKLQLEKQNENLTKQNFEVTFFNMLRNLQSIVNYMVDPHGNKTGRNYLHDLFESFELSVTSDGKYKTAKASVDESNKDILKDVVIDFYNNKFEGHSYNLGHYFRTIHNILKLIETQLDSKELRQKYASILQAQLSNDELGFILYNCLSSYSLNKEGKPEFKRMVDELNILENIDEKCVFDKIFTSYFFNTNFFFTR